MASYFQMGHDSENLVGVADLDDFKGIILSPVNREPTDLVEDLLSFRDREKHPIEYEIVLDSQLYLPRSDRGKLASHPYFPSDLDSTTELSSPEWWHEVAIKVANYALELGVDAVTSPILLPKTWSDDYYALCSQTSAAMAEQLAQTGISTWLTLIVDLDQMGSVETALRVSSIVSEYDPAGYYLVVNSDIAPRRELRGEDELAGVMHLISLLRSTGKPITVSHASSDLILYKAAGATNCATGKFFNLRRFSKSRYDDPLSGGRVIAYWFEESLLAFLRSADVARIKKREMSHLIGVGNSSNDWAEIIAELWRTEPGKPWLALSWRHYLSWFGKTEANFDLGDPIKNAEAILIAADQNWGSMNGILLDERENDGSWVRNWRQALDEFKIRAGI